MHMGDVHGSAAMYNQVLLRQPGHLNARLNIATLHHRYGRVEDAIVQYEVGIAHLVSADQSSVKKLDTKFHRNLAVANLQIGRLSESKILLDNSLRSIVEENAHVCREDGHDMTSTTSNKVSALQAIASALVLLTRDAGSSGNSNRCRKYLNKLTFCLTHMVHLQKSSCFFNNIELYQQLLLLMTLKSFQEASNPVVVGSIHENSETIHHPQPTTTMEAPLTPFDSLLVELSLSTRLSIAQAASSRIASHIFSGKSNTFASPRNITAAISGKKYSGNYITSLPGIHPRKSTLRLGFISYDFNDHPTAHLVEGIFVNVAKSKRSRVELFVYSYGKDDNSTFRKVIEQFSHRFVNIGEDSHFAAAKIIAEDHVDVLLEMQGHTLGNRLEVVAFKPATLQVNYLVFPGTSGATFLDYIIADYIVLPPEHARYYSEAIVMLPPTYQVSFYERHFQESASFISREQSPPPPPSRIKQMLREKHGLPSDDNAVIFCNFNKAEKVDLVSLHAWMGILQRLPGRGYLWLLEPVRDRRRREDSSILAESLEDQNSLFANNIYEMASAYGIPRHRIIFAPRVDKAQHITRHGAADVFLDTLTYSAHSTATDALFGGLAVLTVPGGSFPNRVGASLYKSFCSLRKFRNLPICETLLPTSVKSFQDTAVRMTSFPGSFYMYSRAYLKQQTMQARKGIFHPSQAVDDFLWGMQALVDVKGMGGEGKMASILVRVL